MMNNCAWSFSTPPSYTVAVQPIDKMDVAETGGDDVQADAVSMLDLENCVKIITHTSCLGILMCFDSCH